MLSAVCDIGTNTFCFCNSTRTFLRTRRNTPKYKLQPSIHVYFCGRFFGPSRTTSKRIIFPVDRNPRLLDQFIFQNIAIALGSQSHVSKIGGGAGMVSREGDQPHHKHAQFEAIVAPGSTVTPQTTQKKNGAEGIIPRTTRSQSTTSKQENAQVETRLPRPRQLIQHSRKRPGPPIATPLATSTRAPWTLRHASSCLPAPQPECPEHVYPTYAGPSSIDTSSGNPSITPSRASAAKALHKSREPGTAIREGT